MCSKLIKKKPGKRHKHRPGFSEAYLGLYQTSMMEFVGSARCGTFQDLFLAGWLFAW